VFTPAEALALLRLPGALDSETALVKRWLRAFAAGFLGFDFNVRVGNGQAPPASLPEPYKSAAQEQSKRIIDVVGYRPNSIYLAEVKGRADPCSVGQIRAYTLLWNRERPDMPVRGSGVICALLDDDMAFVLASEGVDAFAYPELVDWIRRT
jgi:hypothetical protein